MDVDKNEGRGAPTTEKAQDNEPEDMDNGSEVKALKGDPETQEERLLELEADKDYQPEAEEGTEHQQANTNQNLGEAEEDGSPPGEENGEEGGMIKKGKVPFHLLA